MTSLVLAASTACSLRKVQNHAEARAFKLILEHTGKRRDLRGRESVKFERKLIDGLTLRVQCDRVFYVFVRCD